MITRIWSSTMFLFLLAFTTTFAQPTFEWGHQYGTTTKAEVLSDQVIDASGMIYSVGTFEGTVDFDPGAGVVNLTSFSAADDVFVTKIDANGVLQWAIRIGNGNAVEVNDIALDPAGFIILTGTFIRTVDFDPGIGVTSISSSSNLKAAYVLKLTTNAGFVWVRGTNFRTEGVGVSVGPNGDVYTTLNTIQPQGGQMITFPSLGTFSSAGPKFFVWKLSSTGAAVWVKDCSTGNDQPLPNRSIITDASDNFYVAGTFMGTSSVLSLGSLFGPNNITGLSALDGFVFKGNSSGIYVWHRTFVSGSAIHCTAIDNYDHNSFIIGGDFASTVNFAPPLLTHSHTANGSFDGFVLKVDFSNNLTYSYTFGGTSYDFVNDLSVNFAGEIYVAGRFGGTTDMDGGPGVSSFVSAGGSDAYLLKIKSIGGFDWATTYGSIDSENMTVASNDSNKVYCGGSFLNTIDFDHDAPVFNMAASPSVQDIFLLKLSECIASAPIADAGSLANLTNSCSVSAPTAPTATNCLGSYNGTPDVTFPVTTQGTTTVTWTYADVNGNSSTQTQEVVVNDDTAPVADAGSLADITAQCEVTSLTAPTAMDNCEGAIAGTHNASFPITSNTTVTWTYADGNGNSSTQTQEVVINDNTTPVADAGSLADITAQCEVTSLTAPTAMDNCEGAIAGTHNASFPITSSTTVTWTYTDGNNNSSSQTQEVVINDFTDPVGDLASLADVNNQCEVPFLTAPTATDNCSGSVVGTHNALFPITTTTSVTWAFTDGSGNTSTQSQNVVINDFTPPVPAIANLPDVNDNCDITALTAPSASDNCTGNITGTHNASFPITSNTTVTWSYNDGNGNTTTQSQEVVVTPTDNSIAQVDATTLMANEIGNTYQWVDCNDGNSAIAGETDQSFTVVSNGSYAVEIDNGNCTVMSTCIQILTVGIEEVNSKSTVYTSSNQLTIIFNDNVQSGRMSMIDVSGRSVLTTDLNGTRTTLEINVPVGVYLILVETEEGVDTQKIFIQ
jgi:hypothetical protein